MLLVKSGLIKDTRKLKFGIKCMMCMRCIYNCPTKAIELRISKFIPIRNGYSIKNYLSEKFTSEHIKIFYKGGTQQEQELLV